MRVPVDRSVVDMLETNNVERFRARRLQASRDAKVRKAGTRGNDGVVTTTPTAPRSLPSALRQLGEMTIGELLHELNRIWWNRHVG